MNIKLFKCLFVLLFFGIFQVLAQKKPIGGIFSSPFGEFTVGIKDHTISGRYLYQDQYDKETHVYLHQEYFYFYGKVTPGEDHHYDVLVTTIGFDEPPVRGMIDFSKNADKIRVQLEKEPPTGVEFGITLESKNNVFSSTTSLKIIEIGVIKAKKATLYDYDGTTFKPKKGYLVLADDVAVIGTSGAYSKVLYKSPSTGKTTQYFVLTSDLYLGDPALWFKKSTTK